MVEVQQRRLRSLEQHLLSLPQSGVDVEGRVRDEWAQPLRIALVLRRDRLEVEGLRLVHALEPEILLREGDLDLLAEDLRVEDVLDANAEPHRLVGVAGADPALRRADRKLAEPPLARLVDREVPRHDQVGVARYVDLVGRVAAALELVELGDQHLRVDDAAVADQARLAADDPARQRADLVRLVADDDRVAGVRAALVAADDVGVLGEQVDDLALPLVAPLRAHDDGGGHVDEVCRWARLPRARGSRCGRPRAPRASGAAAGSRSGRRRGRRAPATRGSSSRSRAAAAARAG